MLNLNIEKIYSLPAKDPDKYNEELGKAHCLLWSSRKKLGELNLGKHNMISIKVNDTEFILTPDSITNCFFPR